MTDRELEIMEIIRKNPLISQDELANQLMITRSGVAAHIHNLMKKGYIKGKGYIINEKNFVTVIGGNNIDILGIPKDKLIQNNSNSGKIYYTLGGAGRNIAYALSRLNVPNYFLTVYGDDLNGEKFINDCKENNMDTSCCVQMKGEHTSSFMYIDNSQGIKLVGINDMDIYEKMTSEFISGYIDRINCSQYCVLDTNMPEETYHYLYEHVTIPIIIKTTSINKDMRILQDNQKIYVLVTTPQELESLLKFYGQTYVDVKHAVKYLLTKNISHIFVYSVSGGLHFACEGQHLSLKKKPKEIINTNGATAALTSIVLWGLQNHLTWNQIVRYGYTAICIALQSKNPVGPHFGLDALLTQEKILFEPE